MEKIHKFNAVGLEKMLNKFGFMHKLSSIAKEFINFSESSKGNVLDIGAGFGVATISCLMKGANVIACDIEKLHIKELIKRTPRNLRKNLKTTTKSFPYEIDFEQDSINAVLLSHVLSFLSVEAICFGVKKIYDWLQPNGKVFVVNYTPYHKTVEKFIPKYEKRKQNGYKWSGFIKDCSDYCDSKLVRNNLPSSFNLLDKDILIELFTNSGFVIEKCSFLGKNDNPVPKPFQLDGREWVGLVAIKKGQNASA